MMTLRDDDLERAKYALGELRTDCEQSHKLIEKLKADAAGMSAKYDSFAMELQRTEAQLNSPGVHAMHFNQDIQMLQQELRLLQRRGATYASRLLSEAHNTRSEFLVPHGEAMTAHAELCRAVIDSRRKINELRASPYAELLHESSSALLENQFVRFSPFGSGHGASTLLNDLVDDDMRVLGDLSEQLWKIYISPDQGQREVGYTLVTEVAEQIWKFVSIQGTGRYERIDLAVGKPVPKHDGITGELVREKKAGEASNKYRSGEVIKVLSPCYVEIKGQGKSVSIVANVLVKQ